MTTYPLNPTPNRVRNLEAYIVHAEDAATKAQTAAQGITDQVAIATTAAQNALKSAQDAAATAVSANVLRSDMPQALTDGQVAQLLANLQIGQITFGNCQFTYVSPTQCVLKPMNGGLLTVNQTTKIVPTPGITFTTTLSSGDVSLAALTAYYAYVFWTGLTWAWEFSSTPFILDSRGFPIKTGDPTRTCVGWVYTDAAGKFQDTPTARGVATYFHRFRRSLSGSQNGAFTASTSPVAAVIAVCMSWGIDALTLRGNGYASNSAVAGCFTDIGINSRAQFSTATGATSAVAGYSVPTPPSFVIIPPLGLTTAALYIYVGAGTGTWTQCNLNGEVIQ